jgi:hypothetical protein
VRAGEGTKAVVDRGDGGRLDLFASLDGDQRGARVEGHAEASELVLVDLVAATLRHHVHDGHHLDARLDGLIGGDEAHVAAAHDEHALGRPHEVPVQQRLEGAGAHDPWQGVARKGEEALPGSGGHEQPLGGHQRVLPLFAGALVGAAQHAHGAVLEHGEGGAAAPEGDSGAGLGLPREPRGDVEPARARVHCVERAEEAVCLQHELAAEEGLVVDHEAVHAELVQPDGRGEARRTTSHDEHPRRVVGCVADAEWRAPRRQDRQAVPRREPLSRPEPGDAGLHRLSVGEDEALGTLATGAEEPLRGAVPGMVTEDAHAVRGEGGGERLAHVAGERSPGPGERRGLGGGNREDGVMGYAAVSHGG